MGNEIVVRFLDRQAYLSIVIGFTVAVILFVIAYVVRPLSCDMSLSYLIGIVLNTPGFVLSFLIASMPEIPLFLFSSFFYGIMGGLLVSKSRITQWMGILLLCLLILTSCFLIMMAALTCG